MFVNSNYCRLSSANSSQVGFESSQGANSSGLKLKSSLVQELHRNDVSSGRQFHLHTVVITPHLVSGTITSGKELQSIFSEKCLYLFGWIYQFMPSFPRSPRTRQGLIANQLCE